jgi:methylthioribose-1-phosphate isomerase
VTNKNLYQHFSPLQFEDGVLKVLDQRLLPKKEVFISCKNLEDCFDTIQNMAVRGAPCIGFTAIYALALWIKNNSFNNQSFIQACERIKQARPTAVNLEFEVNNVQKLVENNVEKSQLYKSILFYAAEQIERLRINNTKMALFAEQELELLYPKNSSKKKLNILTHCNTGFLACGCIGTALGVIEHLASEDRVENVWVDETRPYLQGSRLTAYELSKLNIPHRIVVEGAASLLMGKGLVDAIFVGADRITANGDTANKIGTSNLSIIAKYYGVPFFVVAPKSSFDIKASSGENIEIEIRPPEEIMIFNGNRLSPLCSEAYNPSFDITEGINISGIICEDKCLKPPYLNSTMEIFNV